MSCGKCGHLQVNPDLDGRVRVRTGYTYRCTAPDPVVTSVPASVRVTVSRTWMRGKEDGEGCPVFFKRPARAPSS